MRTILIAAVLAGCVHPIPMTPQETCGARGMVVAGISVSESNSSDVVIGNNGRSAVVDSSGHTEGVSCRPPRTEAERCDVAAGMAGAAPKADWQDVRAKRLLVYFGVLAFVLPGIIIGAVYSSNADAAEEASVRASTEARSACVRDVVEAERPVAMPPKRHAIAGDHPLFCALTLGDKQTGACFRSQEKCDAYRETEPARSSTHECTSHDVGACFNANVILTQKRITICAVTISDCESELASARDNPDYEITAKQCGIYRYEPEGASGE